MTRALAVWLSLSASVAAAEGRTGVVVTGDARLQAPLAATLEGWLRAHNRETFSAPLDADAINTIVDCFVIEDQACARAIIDKRARSENVVFARIDAAPAKKGSGRDITISALWFVKGHDAIAERRVCEHCGTDSVRSTAEAMMKALAASADMQKPIVEPEVVEPTPPPVVVAPPPPVVIAVPQHSPPPPPPEPPGPDRTLPIAVGVAGAAVLSTGVILMMHDDDGSAPTYRDTKPAGVVVGLAGLGLLGFDVYLWLRGDPRESGPTVAATAHGATVGWMGRF